MTRLCIVEDDSTINDMLYEYLHHDYACVKAYSGSEAALFLSSMSFDLVLLDLMLPGMCGEELIKIIKKNYHIPVIILSAKDGIDSKVSLFEMGADDYICKPFDLKEVKARIQVQLRKADAHQNKEWQGLRLKKDLHTVSYHAQEISLTPHEYRILEILIKNVDRAYTKKEIYEYAWQDAYYGDDKTINVHISNLRSKLTKLTEKEWIETIWGIGFKMKSS